MSMIETTRPAHAVVEPIESPATPEAVAVNFSKTTDPVILESSLQQGCYSRFSVFACDPVDVFSAGDPAAECPLDAFARKVGEYPTLAVGPDCLPFCGGWIGYIGYEAGLGLEGLSSSGRDDLSIPGLRFALYDSAAVFDGHSNQWYAVAVDWPAPIATRRPSTSRRIDTIRRRIESAFGETLEPPRAVRPSSPLRPNMARQSYYSKVRRVKRHIEAGDVYQVNLTQRFTVSATASPIDIYRHLRQLSPSPYGALLSWEGAAVISSSPELFLDLRGREVTTRPIKGTRPRGANEAEDRHRKRELDKSEKDAAELAMIVDLLRNDLGRVCSFGSVRVTTPVEIETHPTVFHRVATIKGNLAIGRSWVDLLKASFPGGSITGAPKIRAMQIIDELEPTRRTVYCGSIGYVGLDGSLSMNIAIRTMVQTGDAIRVFAGGGIVADSEPDDEYDELVAKARAMLAAVGCDVAVLSKGEGVSTPQSC